MTLATLLVVTGGAAAAAWMPRLIGGAVVIVEHHGSAADVWRQGGMIVLAGALQAVLSALGWALVSSLGQRILAGMREEVIDRALDLPVQTMEITGIGDALSGVLGDLGLPLILAAYVIAVVMRVAQGSATVALVTAAGLMAPAVEAAGYSAGQIAAITVATAAGSVFASHVNDSGFWLVGRLLNMDVATTLRTWTVQQTLESVIGFVMAGALFLIL